MTPLHGSTYHHKKCHSTRVNANPDPKCNPDRTNHRLKPHSQSHSTLLISAKYYHIIFG